MAATGIGAGVVSLLLFAGCRDSEGGGEQQPDVPSTISTETLNSGGPVSVTVPGVTPPSRPSSSAENTDGCGFEGVACTETSAPESTSDSDSVPPGPDEMDESTG